MSWKIPLFEICWDEKDIISVNKVIRSGAYWAEGNEIKEFEDRIAKYIGTKYCVVFNSGTSALHAILLSYGIKEGDEVIVPSFTFISTANAPKFVGAKPVFADIEKETFGLDPADVKKKITSRTKAIIAVHYGGCPCRINELKKIAKEHNIYLIEDAAESFGSRIRKKKVGTYGDCSMFSFCQNKIITTGEGGAATTNNKFLYEKLKLIRSHGRSDNGTYFSSTESLDYIIMGYNFRMPSYAAALGVSQLNKVDKIIKQRRNNAEFMSNKIKAEINEVIIPCPPRDYCHLYQLYSIRVMERREELMKYLAAKGIMTKIYFDPIHSTHYYKNELKEKCKLPLTEEISKQILSLPMYPSLTREKMNYIIKEMKCFFRRKK